MSLRDFDGVVDAFAKLVARHVVDELRAGATGDMVDQAQSELGPRRHCAHARKLVSRGDARAAIVGRRHLLTREAIAEARQQETTKRSKAPSKAPSESEVAQSLGLTLVRGGGR